MYLQAKTSALGVLAPVATVGVLVAVATAQEADPSAAPLAVCAAADSGECSACHECCFAMDAETCAACVADACPANQCAPSSECNVCDACCKAFLSTQANCDSCVAAECGTAAPGPPPPPPPSPPAPAPPPLAAAPAPAPGGMCFGEHMYSCAECAEQCWQPWAQCLRACPHITHIFLLIAVILPYAGRVCGDFMLGQLFGAFGNGRRGGELGFVQVDVEDQHAFPGLRNRQIEVSREREEKVNIGADGLEWQYEAQVQDGRDCVMSVEFEEGASSYRQRQASEVLERPQRVERVHGHHIPEVAGALVFKFDNSFSWIHDKQVKLKVTPRGIPRRQRGVTMSYACSEGSSWREAQQMAGLGQGGAVMRTLGRLLFWHVLQPLSYFAAFHTTAHQLDWLQYLLGAVVGVREGVYLLATFAALVKNPTFLLLQIEACLRDRDASGAGSGTMIMNGGPSFLLMYTLQPERVVERVLFSDGGVGKEAAGMFITAGAILDLIGVAALGYGLSQGNLPPVLGVSYACTSAGGLAMLVALVGSDARDDAVRRTTSSSSPRGSPRSPRGGLGGGSQVMVYSKSAGQWCKAQTPLLSPDSVGKG